MSDFSLYHLDSEALSSDVREAFFGEPAQLANKAIANEHTVVIATYADYIDRMIMEDEGPDDDQRTSYRIPHR